MEAFYPKSRANSHPLPLLLEMYGDLGSLSTVADYCTSLGYTVCGHRIWTECDYNEQMLRDLTPGQSRVETAPTNLQSAYFAASSRSSGIVICRLRSP